MRSSEWALIQHDWMMTRGKMPREDGDRQGEHHVMTQADRCKPRSPPEAGKRQRRLSPLPVSDRAPALWYSVTATLGDEVN